MSLPDYFPNPDRSQVLIDQLLDRVRTLDPEAKNRLTELLSEEADLPMLDQVERRYREKVVTTLSKMPNRDVAQNLGNALRSHFVRNLNLQRSYLHGLVRNVLQDAEEDMHGKSITLGDSSEITEGF